MSLLSKWFKPSTVYGPSSGLYHYLREDEFQKSRIHLCIDPDGTGTLIVNASSVMHLNPTATFMAVDDIERERRSRNDQGDVKKMESGM